MDKQTYKHKKGTITIGGCILHKDSVEALSEVKQINDKGGLACDWTYGYSVILKSGYVFSLRFSKDQQYANNHRLALATELGFFES